MTERYTYERIEGRTGTHYRITDTRTDDRIATCHFEANAQVVVRLLNAGDKAKAFYDSGYVDGLEAFAWWKDGEQLVGSCGMRLADAIGERNTLHNYGQRIDSDGQPTPWRP